MHTRPIGALSGAPADRLERLLPRQDAFGKIEAFFQFHDALVVVGLIIVGISISPPKVELGEWAVQGT